MTQEEYERREALAIRQRKTLVYDRLSNSYISREEMDRRIKDYGNEDMRDYVREAHDKH